MSVAETEKVNLELTGGELWALEALTAYGDEDFLQWFYQHMGRDFLQPHESDLISLFAKVREVHRALRSPPK